MATTLSNSCLKYQLVLENLRNKLREGFFPVNSILPPIPLLAKEYQVNPASIREAYRILEEEGMVEVQRGRGTRVLSSGAPLDKKNRDSSSTRKLGDLIEAWKIIKPEVAALAALRATPTEAKNLVNIANDMIALKGPGEEFSQLDYRFDHLLFIYSRNITLEEIFSTFVKEVADCTRSLQQQFPLHVQRCSRYHYLIAESISAHNPAAARAFMVQHIEDIQFHLIENGGELNKCFVD